MDVRYTAEILNHLEVQDKLLWDAYRSMTHEVQKLQFEEEMLMRKLYDFMSAQGSTGKKHDGCGLNEVSGAPNDAPGVLQAPLSDDYQGVAYENEECGALDTENGELCSVGNNAGVSDYGDDRGDGALVNRNDGLQIPQSLFDDDDDDWGAEVAKADKLSFSDSDDDDVSYDGED